MRLAPFAVLLILLPVASADWPEFRHDSRNTGQQTSTAFAPYVDLWWSLPSENSAAMEASPVVAQGIVVLGGWNKVLRGVDVESGKPLWNVTFPDRILSTPAISGGRVYAADAAGNLKAIDLRTGALLASGAVGPTAGSITASQGKIFIGNEAGVMYAFESQYLTPLWQFRVDNVYLDNTGPANAPCKAESRLPARAIRGKPAVYGQKVFFGSLNNVIFAINEEGEPDGTTHLQWINVTNDIMWASPTIDSQRERVIFGGYDQGVYSFPVSPAGQGTQFCFGLKNQANWTYSVPASVVGLSKVHSSPATDGSKVYFGTNGGQVYAINAGDGTKAWSFDTEDLVISSPAVANGIVVVGSDDRHVYWLSSSSGQLLKSFVTDGQIKSSPAIDADKVFASTFTGTTYLLGPKIPPRPDLTVTNITYDGAALNLTVANTGTGGSAAANLVRLTVADEVVANLTVPALSHGASTNLLHAAILSVGSRQVSAFVDHNDTVLESNETNNVFAKDIVVLPPAPDLVVSSVVYTDGLLTIMVSNNANGPSAATSVRLFIDAALIADLQVPALVANQGTSVIHPIVLKAGAHSVNLHVDLGGSNAESDETNNVLNTALTVTATKKDSKFLGIPGPPLPLILVALALLAIRRRSA